VAPRCSTTKRGYLNMRYITFMIVFVLASCSRGIDEIEQSIQNLELQEQSLKSNVKNLQQQVEELKPKADQLEATVQSDGDPVYLLTIKNKKSRFSLDVIKHLKDEVNAFEFTIPVDRSLYNSVSIGDKLADSPTWGSSFCSSVTLTVTNKEVRARQ